MALLTSADFADLISLPLLIRLTNDTAGAASVDEDVIDKCSAAAWDEMWATADAAGKDAGFEAVGIPATIPTVGPYRELLRNVTRYKLYSRRPELLATPEGEVIRLERGDAMKLMAAMGKAGLTLSDLGIADTETSGSLDYYSNDVVYDKTTYRGF